MTQLPLCLQQITTPFGSRGLTPRPHSSIMFQDFNNVRVLTAMTDPQIVLFEDFLSQSECETLISLAKPRMSRSMTVNTETGTDKLHDARTSNGMFFLRGENNLVRDIEQRIANLLNWPVNNGEGLQILQYKPGAEYKPHYDYFQPDLPGNVNILQRGGQRIATLIIYLTDVNEGGGTIFPDVNFKVFPKRGNALFFSYPLAHPSSKTLHGGLPVISGEKWIATKWLRQGVFN